MEVKELWATLEQAIKSCTGLSLVTFTVMVVVVAFYYLVSACYELTPVVRKREVEVEPVETLSLLVQLNEVTEEIITYTGFDFNKPHLMAIKCHIYIVTQSRKQTVNQFICNSFLAAVS